MKLTRDELSLMADVRSMLFDVQERFEERIVDSNRESRRNIIDDISAISLLVDNYSRRGRVGDGSFGPSIQNVLVSRIDSLLESNGFSSLAKELKYRPSRVGSMAGRLRISSNGISVYEAIKLLRKYLDEYGASDEDQDYILSTTDAPPQKPGPLQFDIVAGKISLAANTPQSDERGLESALARISKQGKELLESLRESNADPRLQSFISQHIEDIHTENIVSLGIYNVQLGILCESVADELPNIVLGLLQGYIAAIGMIAAQSNDWRAFLENASSAQFDSKAIEEISATTNNLVSHLQLHPEIVDEDVPKSFVALRELISDPKKVSGKVVFAMVRSIENFTARTFQHLQDLVEKTASKSVDSISTTASVLIVATLTNAIIAGGTGLMGLNIPGLNWLGPVIAVVTAYAGKHKPPGAP